MRKKACTFWKYWLFFSINAFDCHKDYQMSMNEQIKDKKHIAMYIGSLTKGGAERVMSNLAEFFLGEGYNVTIVTTYYEDDEYNPPHALWKRNLRDSKSEEYVCEEVLNPRDDLRRVYHLRDEKAFGIRRVFTGLLPAERRGRIYNFIKRFNKLENTWKKLKPDLILSFIGKNNIMAIKTAGKLGIPVVVSVRANPPMEYYTKTLKAVANKVFPKAAGVVLQTNGAIPFFSPKVSKKCHVLPNSITEEFTKMEVVPFENKAKTIVSVGRLDDNKNQKVLIRAFVALMDKYPDYKLLLLGDGESRREFEEEAEKATDPSKIIFLGNVDNVHKLVSEARIFVLTSREEGLPNALIEAMALGLVAVSTDCPCGGPADIITDGEDGILIPLGSDEEVETSLVTVLDKIMSDEELARRLGNNALKVRERYSPSKINAMWKEYFETIMSEEREIGASKKTFIEYIKQFVSFGLIGGLNTLLALGIYWLVVYLGGHYLLGSAVGFVITVAISYVLNNLYTFKGDEKPDWSLKKLLKVYVSYALTGLILNNFLLWLWIDVIGINKNIAPVINLFFTIPLNFLLNKLWAYKKK